MSDVFLGLEARLVDVMKSMAAAADHIEALEAQIAAADRLAENLADNLTWVLPMARGYAAAHPHDVNRRLISGAEDDLAAYHATKEPRT